MNDAPLLEIHAIRKVFPRSDGGELLVLDDVNANVAEGEIVGLLGRSGSGKSTLLRLIAGLARPSDGTVTYLGQAVSGPAPGIAMSSAFVYFVLKEALEDNAPPGWWWMSAFGAGFTCHGALLAVGARE